MFFVLSVSQIYGYFLQCAILNIEIILQYALLDIGNYPAIRAFTCLVLIQCTRSSSLCLRSCTVTNGSRYESVKAYGRMSDSEAGVHYRTLLFGCLADIHKFMFLARDLLVGWQINV